MTRTMTSRQRFRVTLSGGRPDRVPYLEEGIRHEVRDAWHRQGMPAETLAGLPFDRRIEIQPDLDPMPGLDELPATSAELDRFARSLDDGDPRRMPESWEETVRGLADTDTVRMLRVHNGLFLSMGVRGWDRFRDLMLLLGRRPDLAREAMRIRGAFCAALAGRLLDRVAVDAAIFSEPIGGNDRPLVSPAMYDDIVLASYEPLLDLLRRRGVGTIIFRTYANARILIPRLLERGIDCLWACEVELAAMDYRRLRREFGRRLRLIGGLDLDALRRGRAAIRRELEEKLPPLLDQGGFVPLADGRVRQDVRWEDYCYYRELLARLTSR